jgi:Ca2+/Na+ antiporter
MKQIEQTLKAMRTNKVQSMIVLVIGLLSSILSLSSVYFLLTYLSVLCFTLYILYFKWREQKLNQQLSYYVAMLAKEEEQ